MRLLQRLAVVFLLVSCLTQGLFARHPKVARDLDGVSPTDRVDVIVQYKADAYSGVAGTIGAKHRNIPDLIGKKSLRFLNSEVASVRARDLALLADDPDVEFVRPDRPLSTVAFTGSADYGWITAGAKA